MSPGPFRSACVASPHHLASAAGLSVLRSGGNALDAAIATNLTLAVVIPYLCGFGGDVFAIVWKGSPVGYCGAGRAPSAATPERVRAAVGAEEMPVVGPFTVTVPGAVEGWHALLERFGTKPFGELASAALVHAREGFRLSAGAMEALTRSRAAFAGAKDWQAVYGGASEGATLRQPALARTIERIAAEGPGDFYRGEIGQAIARHVGAVGGLLDQGDLAEHRGEWVDPLGARWCGVEVLELPPPTQGVTALEALNIVRCAAASSDGGTLPPDGPDRQHLLIEAVKLALADRDAHVSDPDSMVRVRAGTLASEGWALQRFHALDPARAGHPAPGRAAAGGTAYMCAADEGGMMVSLIQSNFMGFGSGVTVPDWGINLQNRGASFSLDPGHVNVIAPRKRTMHTLIPALALREGHPWMAFGTMGGDGQAQTHVQLLARMVDDAMSPQAAVDAPRWVVSPRDWSVTMESRFDPAVVQELRARGHRLAVTGPFDSLLGHAHAIQVTPDGYVAGSDPRSEGAAVGF